MRWQAHREVVRVARFSTQAGETGFLFVDRSLHPPAFILAQATGTGLAVRRGDLPEDELGLLPLERIADDLLHKRYASHITEVPFSEGLHLLGLAGEGPGEIAETSVRRFIDGLGDPRLAARLPLEGLLTSEVKRFAASGLAEIAQSFDPKALKALAAVKAFKTKDYTWYAEAGDKGDIRRAAAAHFPLFATFMVERFSVSRAIDAQVFEKKKTEDYLASEDYALKLAAPVEKNGVTHSLREWMAIEGRDSAPSWQLAEKAVRQALQGAFGSDDKGQPLVPNHVFSNLRGVTWSTKDVSLERVVSALAELPADWAPKTEQDWDAFINLTSSIGRALPQFTGTPLRTLYEGCSGKWADYQERVMRAFADSRPPEGVTAESLSYLETNIDWKALESLPRDKVEAGATESVARLENFPPELDANAVVKWIKDRIAPDVSQHAIKAATGEITDMVDLFARKVIMPSAVYCAAERSGSREYPLAEQHNMIAARAAAQLLTGGKSVVRLMEMTRIFVNNGALIAGAGETDHANKKREEARLAELEVMRRSAMALAIGIDPEAPIPENGWPALTEIVKAPNGVYIVPLTDPKLLADEGRGWGNPHDGGRNADGSMGLGICVGTPSMGYAGRCRTEGQHILSFRIPGSQDGGPFTRLGCNQVGAIKRGHNSVTTLQFRGVRNGNPDERAMRAWEWYREEIKEGRIALNFDGVFTALASSRRQKIDEVALGCGFDWNNRHLLSEAYEAWHPFLSKKHRKMSPEQMAREPEISPLVDSLDPPPAPYRMAR